LGSLDNNRLLFTQLPVFCFKHEHTFLQLCDLHLHRFRRVRQFSDGIGMSLSLFSRQIPLPHLSLAIF
jgi:hypothetical protein